VERTGSLTYGFVDVCVCVGGFTNVLQRGLIYHVGATGGVGVREWSCVCVRYRGMDPAALGPLWLFLLLSTASVCALIKTLNLMLPHSLAHTPSTLTVSLKACTTEPVYSPLTYFHMHIHRRSFLHAQQ